MTKPANPFVGRWRITHMDLWDQDFVDAEVVGHFTFAVDGSGEFQFGSVSGGMDGRLTTRDGQPCVEWTWDGSDEMDPAQGRGSSVLQGGELHGLIAFHQGDESAFVAVKRGRRS